MRGRGGILWSNTPPRQRRRGPQDILTETEGLTAAGKVTSILQSWQLFFTQAMITMVCLRTNEKGNRVYAAYNQAHPATPKQFNPIDSTELLGFIGLLYFAGIFRGKIEPYRELWSTGKEFGQMIFNAAMPLNRFSEILRLIRFDDKNTREDQKKTDNFAAHEPVC